LPFPGFWAFLFSPVLDVRFSRRWYAIVLAVIAAVMLFVAFLNLDHLGILKLTLTIGFFAAYLYQSAIGGWLSNIMSAEEEKAVSVWITVGNVGGFGLMAILCNQLVAHFSTVTVAAMLAVLVMLPTLVFPFMQAPGPDRRLASESFSQFFGDLWALVKRREVLIAVALFIAPVGTFSLTNVLGARGNDYHASASFVGFVGGAGVAVGGIAGCFLLPPLSRFLSLRWLYLAIAFVGALCTLALIFLPRTPNSYAVTLIAENLLQSFAIATSMAIIFETIGRNNPLASTTFCFVSSMYGVPISLMPYWDSFGYTRGGISGCLLADGAAGLVASVLLGGMLFWFSRRGWLVGATS
jgi:MFS transporter, PAT family, beta-lactamase induction signal transducer AmpG